MAFRLRGRVRSVAPGPAGGGGIGAGVAVLLGDSFCCALRNGEVSGSARRGRGKLRAGVIEAGSWFYARFSQGNGGGFGFRSVVGPRNVSKQHESCFVFEQTTGLVGLAVCESPHEVCTSFLPSVLSSQGRQEPCDLVGKANGIRRFQAPNYNSA